MVFPSAASMSSHLGITTAMMGNMIAVIFRESLAVAYRLSRSLNASTGMRSSGADGASSAPAARAAHRNNSTTNQGGGSRGSRQRSATYAKQLEAGGGGRGRQRHSRAQQEHSRGTTGAHQGHSTGNSRGTAALALLLHH